MQSDQKQRQYQRHGRKLAQGDHPERRPEPDQGERDGQQKSFLKIPPHHSAMRLADDPVNSDDLAERDAREDLEREPEQRPGDLRLGPRDLETLRDGQEEYSSR